MQWKVILEEHTPGTKNTAADVLSRLDIADTCNPVGNNIKSVNQ